MNKPLKILSFNGGKGVTLPKDREDSASVKPLSLPDELDVPADRLVKRNGYVAFIKNYKIVLTLLSQVKIPYMVVLLREQKQLVTGLVYLPNKLLKQY